MSNQVLLYLVILLGAVFLVIILAYLRLRKKMQSAQYKQLQQLKRGTQKTAFSSDIIYQKLYLKYRKIPLIKRYLLKLRRRLEIINIDDEYLQEILSNSSHIYSVPVPSKSSSRVVSVFAYFFSNSSVILVLEFFIYYITM